jgi:hypothetical protein
MGIPRGMNPAHQASHVPASIVSLSMGEGASTCNGIGPSIPISIHHADSRPIESQVKLCLCLTLPPPPQLLFPRAILLC